jgi:NAD-dependent SIR2 family protein deacetylase
MNFQDDLFHWLPDELINAQREGKLLLFCGAGISQSVGLPSFEKLVENIAKKLFNLTKNNDSYVKDNGTIDKEFTELMEKQHYDRAIFYLENKLPDYDRKCLIEYLKKELIKQDASSKYHQIILELASSSKGTRVVTTNFDDLFEKAQNELTNQDDIQYTMLL